MKTAGRIGTAAAAALAWLAMLPAAAQPSPDYAESVAVYGLTGDGSGEVRVRLARFPGQGRAALWLSVVAGGTPYAVVDSSLSLSAPAAATTVEADSASFTVAADAGVTVSSSGRRGPAMEGRVKARALAHRTRHPSEGSGALPVQVDLTFQAWQAAVAVRPGRREVFGDVTARVATPDGEFTIDGPGKWHEQVGPRPGFAPAFTYLWGARRGARSRAPAGAVDHPAAPIGLLARGGAGAHWGYLVEGARVTPVSRLVIDAPGQAARRFTVTLTDGRDLSGSATALRETSVPIEGRRRPSATVRIDVDGAPLLGHLNDWHPDDEESP